MIDQKLKGILDKIKVPLEDAEFYPESFALLTKEKKSSDKEPLKKVIEEEYPTISHLTDISKIQDSSSVRNVLMTRSIVNLLISDDGELNFEYLKRSIDL